MSSVKKYIIFQIVFTIACLLFLMGEGGNNIQYSVLFFPISGILFIGAANKEWQTLSQYLKDNNPLLYKNRSTYRKYISKDLIAVNFLSVRRSELNEIDNQQIIVRIKKIRIAQKTMLVSMLVVLILLLIRSYTNSHL